MLHKLAHLFGRYYGHVYSWWDSDTGKLIIGFKCATCGDIGGVHVSREGTFKALQEWRRSMSAEIDSHEPPA